MTLKNTEKHAIISIKNIQTANDMDEETELITECKFYNSNNKIYVFYEEDASEDVSPCTVMLVISNDEVIITRKGEFGSKMHYREGEKDQVIYHTPYGNMILLLKTIKIHNQLSDSGGKLSLIYQLTINNECINNNLTITINSRKDD